MSRDIDLNGGEIVLIKALGLTGTSMPGKFLIEHMENMEAGEFIDTLEGLISQGYVLSTKVNIRNFADVERSSFRVNPSYAHDLRFALDPARRRELERRRRRRS